MLVVASLVLFAVTLYRNAWLCDDAYITYRTIDNFVNGYGLRWNVAERVQTFTHPLWMWVNAAVYFGTREDYYTFLAVPLIISVAGVVVFALGLGRSATSAAVATLGLTCSKAFVDYSTSGLENPLTHLLLVLFFLVYRAEPMTRRHLAVLSWIAWLGALNRMDSFLLFLPPLIWAWSQVRGWRAVGTVVVGSTPFVAWEFFSLVYYGSLFPNTAYAKLNTGIPQIEMISQGVYYFWSSLKLDRVTLPVIALALLVALGRRVPRWITALGGAVLYLLYVMYIGGDFMNGRFLTAPFLIAVIVLCQLGGTRYTRIVESLGVVVIAVLVAAPGTTHLPVRSGTDYDYPDPIEDESLRGVYNERGVYYPGTGLLRAGDARMPTYDSAESGRQWRVATDQRAGPTVASASMIGMLGFYAGPKVHIVDSLALGDPLLARMPPLRTRRWKIGHYRRGIPQGYIETLQTGTVQLQDPNLGEYYRRISLITRGDLLDAERLSSIAKLSVGGYDGLIDRGYYGSLSAP